MVTARLYKESQVQEIVAITHLAGDFQERRLPLPSDFSKLDNILFNKAEPKVKMVEVKTAESGQRVRY